MSVFAGVGLEWVEIAEEAFGSVWIKREDANQLRRWRAKERGYSGGNVDSGQERLTFPGADMKEDCLRTA